VQELEGVKRDLLRQTSITTVAGKIITNGHGARENSVNIPSSTELPTSEELKHCNEERKFEAFLQAYRLSGVSLIKCDNGTLLFELLTSYKGQ